MGAVIIGVVILISLLVLVSTIKSLIIIVPPNRAAVITGRKRQSKSGETLGYRVVIGGRTFRIPILESVSWIPLDTIPMELKVTNAFSKGGIPLSIDAVANIKVASEPETVFFNAVERLLGKTPDQIRELAKETLSANLRGVLATLTPEEVNEDRLKFANELMIEADGDLEKLGLQLDILKVQNVSDEVDYLAAIGRVKTAEVLKNADVAEAQAQAETKRRQAESKQEAQVAEAKAQIAISEAQNELRVRQAELSRQAEIAEKVAKVAAQQAEVEAKQTLETQRIALQQKTLQADVVEPAEAERMAAESRAKAAAAPILESGRAQAEVLRLLYSEIQQGGEHAVAILLAEKLPQLFSTAVDAMKDVNIERLVVVDGGNGSGVSNAAGQRMVGAVQNLEALSSAFGINLQDVLSGATRKLSSGSEAQ